MPRETYDPNLFAELEARFKECSAKVRAVKKARASHEEVKKAVNEFRETRDTFNTVRSYWGMPPYESSASKIFAAIGLPQQQQQAAPQKEIKLPAASLGLTVTVSSEPDNAPIATLSLTPRPH